MVMSLIAAAKAFGWLLAYLRIPALVTTSLLNITTNPILLLLLINGLLILLGCIMDMAPLILITTPILYPIEMCIRDSGTTIATWILLGSFAIMLILRIPITFALAASSIFTAMYLKIPLMVIIQQMVQGVNSFSLMAIPFFIIAGEIMGEGGISQRLIEFANVIVGRFRGGLALVNVLASTFFGGISGSAVADVSSIGAILIPMMKKQGYDTDYSVAVTVTSACQGIIIPPSHNMIIYSLAAGGVSVGRLFLGGFIPGITLGIALMIVSYIMAVKRNYPTERSYSFKEALFITKDALFGIFTAVIILGGVISGIFTATESAAIACVYAFIITFFVYREIPLSRMNKILSVSYTHLDVYKRQLLALLR